MNLARFSVRRPIFTTMIFLMIVVIGAVSFSRLRIDLLPFIEMPTLSIRTEYEGASPEVMERLVTRIIEEIVATVPGVEEISSQSSEGNSTVQVSFTWGTSIDIGALDVQSRIEDEIDELPDDTSRPRISKFDIASFPVVILGISSNLDPIEMTELIENQIRYRFGRIPGVAQVDIFGGFNPEVRIQLDPDRIKALAIPMDGVLQALKNANVDLPVGKIEQGRFQVTLRAQGEFTSLDQIRDTVIVMRNGAPVTLDQIAEVKDTYEKITRVIRVNGEPGIRVGIRKQADANTVEVSSAILAEINAVNQAFPQIQVIPVINQGNFIERSIKNLGQSVMYGGGLAILVLLFFLRSLRSTVVISMAIPISIIATFALMYFRGLTLNLMTLGGLALGVGMMVDNSIVVLENIYRRRDEEHEYSETASVEGTREVSGAIIASTITTLVIFLPLIFVQGISGILFKELAYVIIFSLVCSLLVSLSLVPMLTSQFLKKPRKTKGIAPKSPPWIAAVSEQFFNNLTATYLNLLGWVLGHRLIIVSAAALVLGASLFLLPLIGTEFLPPSDEGEVRVSGKMEIGTRLELVDEQTRKMEAIVMPAVPEAISSVVSVGASGRNSGDASQGEIRLSLTPLAQRKRSNIEIAQDLRERLEGKIPGMEIRTRAPQGQFLLERILGGDQGLTMEIRGFELEILDALSQKGAAAIKGVEGITDIEISREAGIPQQQILVDRDKIADFGLSVRDVTQMIKTAVAGSIAGEYRAQGGNSYRILVQLKEAEKRSLDEILDLTLTSASGDLVSLRNMVATQEGRGPLIIDRKDQQRLVTLRANVAGRDLGSIATDVQARLERIPRPLGYDLLVTGNFEEQQKAFDELIISLVLALVLVYMVLACQYESLINPLVVMLSVPVAAVGVLITLFLTHTTLNVQSYIGCIMLGGIVVNNAILLVDHAGQLGRTGMNVHHAVLEAGRRRLRPILMTTLTTILGLMPLALGIGEGAEAQAPLARAVVGGLFGSTLITLVLIPAVYSLFHPEPKGEIS